MDFKELPMSLHKAYISLVIYYSIKFKRQVGIGTRNKIWDNRTFWNEISLIPVVRPGCARCRAVKHKTTGYHIRFTKLILKTIFVLHQIIYGSYFRRVLIFVVIPCTSYSRILLSTMHACVCIHYTDF